VLDLCQPPPPNPRPPETLWPRSVRGSLMDFTPTLLTGILSSNAPTTTPSSKNARQTWCTMIPASAATTH
ncbi:Acidic mammalian chitinase-like, partial [Arapaima gigas]